MYQVILITTKNVQEAKKIANLLVNDKLVACVNIIKDVQSLFWWQGKLDNAKEVLLVIKTKKSKFPKIVKAVKLLHSYSVPEIIALPIVEGNKEYLQWIEDSV